MNIIKFNTNSIYAVGDLHGDFKVLTDYIEKYNLIYETVIVCGDCGFGFRVLEDICRLTVLKEITEQRSVHIIFIRGNHDNPAYFDGGWDTKFIKLVPDYTVLQITTPEDTKNILCIGGGISIDRSVRLKNYDYWEDECVYFDKTEFQILKHSGININVVCTHTCPTVCSPAGMQLTDWLVHDPKLAEDLEREHQVMDKIYDELRDQPIHTWCFGHWHVTYIGQANGIKFRGLDKVRKGKLDTYSI